MPTSSICFLPKTKSWEEFEKMACDCATKRWGKSFNNYGRIGQKQNGIDIISDDGKIAIQCKNYLNVENVNQFKQKIQADCVKISELPFTIETFVIATSLDRDKHIQDFVFSIVTDKLQIEIMFWDDISTIIATDPFLYNKYYSFIPINRNRGQLFTLAFFGVQIAELIGLTLGDRSESAMYCTNLRSGAVWFDDIQIKNEFLNYVNGVESFALGDLSIIDFDNYEQTNAYYWGKCIEKIVNTLLESLNVYDRNYYLAGFYLGNFFRNGINENGITENLIKDFVNVVGKIDIPKENKEKILSLAFLMKDPDKCSDIAGRIYDQLRLIVI